MTMRQRWWLGTFLFALMVGHSGANAYSAWLNLEQHAGSSDGWTARLLPDGRAEIAGVDQNGPAKVLLPGDEFVSINGLTLQDDPQIRSYNRRVRPGTHYTMIVRRQGQLREFALTTVAFPLSRWLVPITDILVQLLFLLTGLIVFLLKPADRQAWLLALMLITFTGLFNSDLQPLPVAVLLMVAAARVVGLLFLPVFCYFFLIFPDRSPLLRRFPRIERWLYLPFYLIVPWFFCMRFIAIFRAHEQWTQFIRNSWLLKQQWIGLISLLIALAYLVFGLVALLISYRVAGIAARRKLHVITVGSGAGFLNLLLLVVWETFFQARFPQAGDWMGVGLKFTLPLIPLSFAYAIIRHKVIPVSLMIRRSVRYLLVSRGSIVLHVAVVGMVMFFVMDTLFSRLPGLTGRAVGVVSAIVGIVAWNLNYWFYSRVLAPRIDRHFFRQSYDAQQIIADLTQELKTVASLPQLLELVAMKIQSALKTENVTIFLRDPARGDYRCAYARDYGAPNDEDDAAANRMRDRLRDCRLPRDGEAIRQLAALATPLDVDLNSINDPDDLRTLGEVKSALLLPLATKDELLGIISLGSRLGDLPFSGEDKKLLTSVAGPATFAIENARLVERMIEEASRRQELEVENEQRAKELEEARQLQFSMLPKTIPQLPHLEIAAYMKTATEVGGDYYDFHLSDSGELTIVVGDATGHGLKAGTMVTATKSLFNHLAATPGITDIFQHSSRALKLMNLRALYMAMTMVKIRGYRMTISAAGMPPILIYRAAETRVEEVFIKGIPLGSMSGYVYREEEVGLMPGDVVVLMSDGFPERFNAAGEMLGYEQATQLLIESAAQSPQGIIERFIHIADVWADGHPLDDDVTFVVLEVS